MNKMLRDSAIEWAKRVSSDPLTVYLDTETTGLGPTAELCDIAIVAQDGEVLLSELILPHRPIPSEATAVHGITDKHVEFAPTFWELYPELKMIIEDATNVVVYNQQYDFGIINQCCAGDDLERFRLHQWECAMLAFSDFDGTPGKYGTPKWWKLPEAAKRLGVAFTETHRALADAIGCRDLVLKMAEAGDE